MRGSRLETKAKSSKPILSKKISDYVFKLTAYLIDGIPIGKNVGTDNKVVYGKFY